MPVQWLKTQYPNVRYYEHGTRRTRNGQTDKYFSIRYYVNGRQREEGVGWATEGWNAEKAYALLGEIRAGLRTGKGPQSLAEKREHAVKAKTAKQAEEAKERQANITLEEFFHTVYMPRAKREKQSWRMDEQRIVKAINPALGRLPLRAVRREDVQKFVDALSDAGSAPATVKQYMGIVRRAFYMAAEMMVDGTPLFIGKNPASGTGIRLPAVHNSRERYLTADEVDKLIAAAGRLRSPDLRDCIILSLNTGLRLGELVRLRWLDVDMDGGFVTVPDEDMRKPGGKVPLNHSAMDIFQRRKKVVLRHSLWK
jgi:integrase